MVPTKPKYTGIGAVGNESLLVTREPVARSCCVGLLRFRLTSRKLGSSHSTRLVYERPCPMLRHDRPKALTREGGPHAPSEWRG